MEVLAIRRWTAHMAAAWLIWTITPVSVSYLVQTYYAHSPASTINLAWLQSRGRYPFSLATFSQPVSHHASALTLADAAMKESVLGSKGRLSSSKKSRRFLPDLTAPTNGEILFILPFFIIIICLLCIISIFNICRDEELDDLHAAGVDVIKDLDGDYQTMPREYEYI